MLSFHFNKVELKKSRRAKRLAPIEGGYVDRGTLGDIDRDVIYSMSALPKARANPPAIVIDSLHNREISDLRPNDELEEVVINFYYPEQTVKVELEIHPEERRILIEFFRNNCNVFAWRVEDMQGISEDVILHKINDDSTFKRIHHKSRYFSPEKVIAIKEEVEKLLKAGIIKEISYPKWLANVVMVKKANDKRRIEGRKMLRKAAKFSLSKQFEGSKVIKGFEGKRVWYL